MDLIPNGTPASLDGWTLFPTTWAYASATTTTTARHRSLYMPGYSPRTTMPAAAQYDADWEATLTNSYIAVYPTCGGTWAGGPLKMIITGYPLEF